MPGRKRSEFRFNAALAVQQAELVQLIAKESLAGGKAKGKAWSDLDRLHKRAQVAQPRAVSIENVDPNSIAGRARRKYGTARTFGKPKGGSTLQSQPRSTRIRCLPITQLPDARRLPSAASGTSRHNRVESKRGDSDDVVAAARNASKSAPSWSIAPRRRPPEDIRREREAAQSSAAAAAPGRSSLGHQPLSTKTSAPAPSFSKLGRDRAARALAAGSLDTPSAQHYHPNDAATSTVRTARAARLAGRTGSPSHSQSMILKGAHAVPGPGHYAVAPGQGPQVLSSRRSAPGVSFGAGFVAPSSSSYQSQAQSSSSSLHAQSQTRREGRNGRAGGSLSSAPPPPIGGRGFGSSTSTPATGGFRGSQSLSSLGASYVMNASGASRVPPAQRTSGKTSLAASMGPGGRPPAGLDLDLGRGSHERGGRHRSGGGLGGWVGVENEEQGWDLCEPPARRARRAAKAVQEGESAELAQRMRIRKLQQDRLVAARNARQPLPPRRRQPAARPGNSLVSRSNQTGHGTADSAREQRAGEEDVHVLADRVLAESARYLDGLNPTEHGS